MKWSIPKAAEEFNTTRETLRRGLLANGIEVKPNGTFTTRDICSALFGDGKQARARKDLADAIAKERENREADRDLIPFTEHESWCNAVLQPIRQWMLALPSLMANKTQEQIQEHVDAGLRIIREKILDGTDKEKTSGK